LRPGRQPDPGPPRAGSRCTSRCTLCAQIPPGCTPRPQRGRPPDAMAMAMRSVQLMQDWYRSYPYLLNPGPGGLVQEACATKPVARRRKRASLHQPVVLGMANEVAAAVLLHIRAAEANGQRITARVSALKQQLAIRSASVQFSVFLARVPFFMQGGRGGGILLGRAAEDLVQNRRVLGHRAFPRGPAPGAGCLGALPRAACPFGLPGWAAPGAPRYVLGYVLFCFLSTCSCVSNNKRSCLLQRSPSPGSRAKQSRYTIDEMHGCRRREPPTWLRVEGRSRERKRGR
jgi:hypothetical protein